jgi:RecB family exonuclease
VELSTVTRSKLLNVTSLSGALCCYLRAVLESERTEERLPTHPEAILGSIVHEALRHSGNRGPGAVLQEIQETLSSARGVMTSSATASGNVSLREVIPATRMSAKLAAARRFAAEYSAPKAGARRQSPRRATANERFPQGSWREVVLASEARELTGQVDLLRVEPNVCTIIDFKTGAATSESDKLVEAYVNQLHFYFLLAKEHGYGPNFRLSIVAADGTFPVQLDDDRLSRLEERLQRVVGAAPLGVECAGRELAHVSESCSSCAFRPWCGAYRAEVPAMWKEERPKFMLPPDIWGTVVKVLPGHSGTALDAVYLRDAASRLVCITGVPERLTSTMMHTNSCVGFFAVQGKGEGSTHPQNFVLGVPGDLRASNHAALVTRM